jgi:hypothetical protein
VAVVPPAPVEPPLPPLGLLLPQAARWAAATKVNAISASLKVDLVFVGMAAVSR